MSTWKTEEDQTEQKPEYKPKAHLVLEGSDQHEWGVVKDCHGNVNHIPEDAEIVGTWNKYGEGVFWVSLETAIQALQDKATILTAELVKKRQEELVHLPTRRRSPPKEPPGPSTSDRLAKLRTKITG